MTTIQIHEFSTGINHKGTPDNWCSQGFTGHYMNSTLSTIPEAVKKAIADDLLTIPEGQIIDKPAIIGQEVDDLNNDAWSIIAIVTQANDDARRPINTYRYFLTQGLGKLEEILRWYIRDAGQPQFNPFDTQQIGQPHTYETNTITRGGDPLHKPEFQNLLKTNEHPIIIPPQLKCVPLIVNELASRKKRGSELISWAYNVEGLIKPWQFGIIYPASDHAEQQIRNHLNHSPQDTLISQKTTTPSSPDNSSQDTFIPSTTNPPDSSNTILPTSTPTQNNLDRLTAITFPSGLNFNSLKSSLFSSQKFPLFILPISILLSLILGFILGKIIDNKHQSLVTHLFKTVTIPALNDIVRSYDNAHSEVDDVKIAGTIVSILEESNPNISLDFLTKYQQNEQKKWIKAIKVYQENANLEPTGIITRDDDTEKRLKCQLQQKLKLPNRSEIIRECNKQRITLE